MKPWIAALALMSYTCCSYALVIEGRVVAVTDGDTVRLLSVSNVEYKVRLTGIDAPEKAQAFGLASKGIKKIKRWMIERSTQKQRRRLDL